MSVTPDAVKAALVQVIDPNTGIDLVASRSAKNIKVDGNKVSLDVELGYPAKSQLALSGSLNGKVALVTGAARGIGASIAVLWYYLLTELKQWRSSSFALLLSLSGARQVMMASALLIQSDWLVAGPQLWQTEQWLSEQSELGFFLQALMGYEATPSLSQILLYLLCFVVLFWCCSLMERKR